jgi:hypothetical protein
LVCLAVYFGSWIELDGSRFVFCRFSEQSGRQPVALLCGFVLVFWSCYDVPVLPKDWSSGDRFDPESLLFFLAAGGLSEVAYQHRVDKEGEQHLKLSDKISRVRVMSRDRSNDRASSLRLNGIILRVTCPNCSATQIVGNPFAALTTSSVAWSNARANHR